MKKQVEQILNWNNEQEIEFIKRSIGNEEIVGLLSQKKMKKSEKVNYLLLNNIVVHLAHKLIQGAFQFLNTLRIPFSQEL